MTADTSETASSLSLPCLAVGLAVMVGGTLYPLLMARADHSANHALAMALFWAMSAGFVRGMGFVPRSRIWRSLFSGWACALALGLAGAALVGQR
jgi:predicted membrane protein